MRGNRLVISCVLLFSITLLSGICCQQKSAIVGKREGFVQPPPKASQAVETAGVTPKPALDAKGLSPKISFEKMLCDLGQVGQDTKNTCDFRFTNTGQGLLKIGDIKRTCGCTVFELEKKEYAPGEAGTVKVTYTAGKSTALSEKHIYVPSNDKDNPNVKLTIKASVVQLVEVTPGDFIKKGKRRSI